MFHTKILYKGYVNFFIYLNYFNITEFAITKIYKILTIRYFELRLPKEILIHHNQYLTSYKIKCEEIFISISSTCCYSKYFLRKINAIYFTTFFH